jgi:photosystem II stability/assembly factor-like uncharacterized protein
VGFLAIDSRNTSTLYAASPTSGIYKSTDGGATWSASSNGLTDGASIVAVDPVTPSTLYSVSYDTGPLLFKSMDGGQNWSPVGSFPASIAPVGCVAIDPVTSSTLYVTEGAAILKSMDGGETWISLIGSINAGFALVPLAIDPKTPSTLYAGSYAGSQQAGDGSISRSTDGGQTWTVIRTGIPTDAVVVSFSIDPAGSGTIYGTYLSGSSGAGILKSVDGGLSWTAIQSFPQSDANSTIVVAPASPPIVYAGYWNSSPGPGGILRSADGGSSWSSVNTGLDYIDLRALTLDPKNPGVLYTAGVGGVFRSADSGDNWSALGAFQVDSLPVTFPGVQNPFGSGPGIVRSLLIDPSNPDNLYADVARPNGLCYFDDLLLFKSVDGGASWNNNISPPESGCVASGALGSSGGMMAIDPADPSVLYLQETDDGDEYWALMRSTDGGANWSTFWPSLETGVNALLIDPNNSAVIYAGLETGFCKTADGGATWRCNGLQNVSVTTLALDPGDPSTLYAGTGSGLFLSKDGGESWTAASNGPAGTITSLVVAGPSGVVYAATSGNGVYRSTDGGEDWSDFSDGLASLDVRALAFAPSLPGTLYAATASGVFKMAGSNFTIGRVR